MWTRFVLFGLCCIVGVSCTSPNSTEQLNSTISNLTATAERKLNGANTQEKNASNSNGTNNVICYKQVGCFETGAPWSSNFRPIMSPESPENIQTTVQLYTRCNKEKPIYISLYPEIKMDDVKFDSALKNVIIVHGFRNSGNVTWMKKMKDVYLQEVDANVMVVDWGVGAQKNYFQVAGNTRVVGKQLALFVEHLIKNYKADPGNFHLIGHSLGAQICSYLAKQVPGIGRLTALDPAQPGFEGFSNKVRLDKTDAKFVDVIHTDAKLFLPHLGFGMIGPHGHVDFYVNGGYNQPLCYHLLNRGLILNVFSKLAEYSIQKIADIVSCSHGRAYMYFTEALNSANKCIFWGRRANLKDAFTMVRNHPKYMLRSKIKAQVADCNENNCLPMGLLTDKSPLRGVFVVDTRGEPPYCIKEKKPQQPENSGGILQFLANLLFSKN